MCPCAVVPDPPSGLKVLERSYTSALVSFTAGWNGGLPMQYYQLVGRSRKQPVVTAKVPVKDRKHTTGHSFPGIHIYYFCLLVCVIVDRRLGFIMTVSNFNGGSL